MTNAMFESKLRGGSDMHVPDSSLALSGGEEGLFRTLTLGEFAHHSGSRVVGV